MYQKGVYMYKKGVYTYQNPIKTLPNNRNLQMPQANPVGTSVPSGLQSSICRTVVLGADILSSRIKRPCTKPLIVPAPIGIEPPTTLSIPYFLRGWRL